MRKRFIKWLREKVIWVRWSIQTLFVVAVIILGMVYGWGLTPKRWTVVIICYLLANALIPLCAYLNYSLAKKMGWEAPAGSHIHKNPPKGVKRRKKELTPTEKGLIVAKTLDDSISEDYRTSHLGKFPGRNMGD